MRTYAFGEDFVINLSLRLIYYNINKITESIGMSAPKQETYINVAAANLMLDLNQRDEVSKSIATLLGKRNASDTTSLDKLRNETEDSRDDDDLDSEEGDDGQKRERR